MRVPSIVALVLCVAGTACGCNSGGANGTLHTDAQGLEARPVDAAEHNEPDAMPQAKVILGSPETTVNVALARTRQEQTRGLMYVQNLPVDDGMLFIFDVERDQEFWMKNTLIPLDMIFIRNDLTIAGIVANATPLSEEPRGVGKPSRYVLEVNGGWAAAHGVTADSKVRFEGF